MPDDHRQATTQVITMDDRFGTHRLTAWTPGLGQAMVQL
jgi:hypothetical protein